MSRKYEIPYQGNKLKIAQWVITNLPSADVFVDLFAGFSYVPTREEFLSTDDDRA